MHDTTTKGSLSPHRCLELQQWILSLTWSELQNSMEYTIQCPPDVGSNENSNSSNDSNSNSCGSFNEHFCLMEMLRLLAPPPVPIHPAALASCRPAAAASNGGGGDGNHWVDGRMSECERLRRKRRDEPRLFCWLPQQTTTTPSAASSGRDRQQARIPPELQALLSGSKGNGNTTGHSPSTKPRPPSKSPFQKPRGGESAAEAPSSCSFTEYDVVARSFFATEHSTKGDKYSIPPTEDLRRADDALLQQTVLRHTSTKWMTNHNDTTTPRHGRNRSIWSLRLNHLPPDDNNDNISPKRHDDDFIRIQQTLRLLRIASRGKFLSRSPPSSFFNNTNNDSKFSLSMSPWFEMELDNNGGALGGQQQPYWFSLSMYLASQFEVALWKSFQKHQRFQATRTMALPTISISTPSSNAIARNDPEDDDHDACHRRIMDRLPMPSTMHMVTARALSQILVQDAALLPNTRGGALWSLMEESICFGDRRAGLGSVGGSKGGLEDLFACPLLHVGSKSNQLRSLARLELERVLELEWKKEQVELALRAEKELLQGLANMDIAASAIAQKSSSCGSAVSRKKKRAKRKNAKKKPIQGSSTTATASFTILPLHPVMEQEETATTTSTRTPPVVQQDSTSSEDDDDDDKETACLRNSSVLDFPENPLISQRVRNRNIVLAWSVLDDIVKEVFVQVGLPPDEPDGFDDDEQQQQQQEQQVGVKEGDMLPTLCSQPPVKGSQLPIVDPTTTSDSGSRRVEPTITEDEELTWPHNNSGTLLSAAAAAAAAAGTDNNPRVGGGAQQPMRLGTAVPVGARYRGAFDVFSSPYNTLAGRFFVRPPDSIDFAWDGHEMSVDDGSWDPINGYGGRDRSIMEEFFLSQQRREQAEENIMASSTMASIASSAHESETEDGVEEDLAGEILDQPEIPPECLDGAIGIEEDDPIEVQVATGLLESKLSPIPQEGLVKDKIMESSNALKRGSRTLDDASQKYDSRSPSPHAPATPSPTLSPILVSLADLREMRQDSKAKSSPSDGAKAPSVRSFSSVPTANLPPPPQKMVTSLSRDNLRATVSSDEPESRRTLKASPTNASESEPMGHASAAAVKHALKRKSRDDHDIKTNKGSFRPRPVDALESYRNAAVRSLKSRDDQDIRQFRATPPRSTSYRNVVINRMVSRTTSETLKHSSHFQFDSAEGVTSRGDRCVRSEMGHDDNIHWHESRRSHGDDHDNNTVTRDGSTTITSALSHRETEESIREERDTFRDICLTLGAEVAKLKNILAAQKGSIITTPAGYAHNMARPAGRANFFDPESVARFFYNTPRSQTLAAMSDAGLRGEHESVTASEDEVHGKLPGSRHVSSGATAAGSDVSIEHSAAHLNFMVGVPMTRDFHDPIHLSGVQSRLAADIMRFVDITNVNLRKQDAKRSKAVERMTRLVNTVWPRAQVKLYGSHVTGLSLPSSDVDFVICLPAVHKNAPAVAPGALEGRNAINETSQKLLARKLKSESWIDPRSMKLIERTVVPVIKVATKDTKAKTLQLDITFDGPSHHGLEAVELVSGVLEELPMIRPLVLVLKQFLLDRGLLTGFTGGLSSYCLFLMTARYLQEQVSSWSDCGSLLMGFLDFYGNHFDPRTTGISVGCGQYFARPTYAVPHFQASPQPQPMWDRLHRHNLANAAASVREKSFTRRNSFNDKGSVDGIRGTTTGMAMGPYPATSGGGPPHHYPPAASQVEAPPVPPPMDQGAVDHGMPYTFDPLFVEDPLSPGNNVGRNAFRIFQVQRAFSDAHRALVAALEWDMQSTGELQDGSEYPLLKCLLQTEDVVYDL